jgi:hypothetical protein
MWKCRFCGSSDMQISIVMRRRSTTPKQNVAFHDSRFGALSDSYDLVGRRSARTFWRMVVRNLHFLRPASTKLLSPVVLPLASAFLFAAAIRVPDIDARAIGKYVSLGLSP